MKDGLTIVGLVLLVGLFFVVCFTLANNAPCWVPAASMTASRLGECMRGDQ